MKKIYGFAFAAAVMALASCSNDSEPVVNPTPAPEGPGSYLAINICNPAGTRADDEFEIGSTDENSVNNAKFVILKENGGNYEVAYVVEKTGDEISLSAPGNYPGNVERFLDPVIVIPESVTAKPNGENVSNVPNNLKLLVLLNYNGNITAGTTETQLLNSISNVSVAGTANSFVMTNAAYEDNGTSVCAVALPYEKLVSSEEIAKKNPVDVYVERVVARANVDKTTGDQWEEKNNDMYWQNNSQDNVTLTPKILGVAFYADPSASYLFKHTDGWNSDWAAEDLHDVANHRSYWATMPEYNGTDYTLNTFKFSDAAGSDEWEGTLDQYIRENTLGGANATKVVVLAQLMKDGSPMDMANVFGQYTTKAGAAALVANTLKGEGYRIQTTDAQGNTVYRTINYSETGDTDLKYSGEATKGDSYVVGEGDGNRTYLELVGTDVKYVKENGLDADKNPKYDNVEATEITAKLQGAYAISYWKDGYCYYYTDIEHTPFVKDVKNPGVVRNHVYKVTFTGISGFGTPVFDPEKIVIPTPPTYEDNDLVFLSAKVNILKWKVVSQSLILGE